MKIAAVKICSYLKGHLQKSETNKTKHKLAKWLLTLTWSENWSLPSRHCDWRLLAGKQWPVVDRSCRSKNAVCSFLKDHVYCETILQWKPLNVITVNVLIWLMWSWLMLSFGICDLEELLGPFSFFQSVKQIVYSSVSQPKLLCDPFFPTTFSFLY